MLPNFIRAIQKSGHSVLWICDPMHGNTQSIPMGELGNKSTLKTRDFQDILEETLKTFRIHKDLGTFCSGLHLESSEDPLTTECLGGVTEPLLRTDLCHGQYTTTCDPRLNPAQVLDLFNCLLDDFIF